MDKIYLWIGLTTKTEEEYWNYFYKKGEKPQFCFDVGLEYLDEDFMGYYYNKNSTELNVVIENTPDSGLHESIAKACMNKNIKQANTMFYYTGDEIKRIDENKKYNDLTFIGVFDWE